MASPQLTAYSISGRDFLPSYGLRPSTAKVSSVAVPPLRQGGLALRSSGRLVVKAATTVAPKYTSLKPLGDRVLVKIKVAEEKTVGGILLPSTAQTKPQSGDVVAVGEGRKIGNNKVGLSVKTGAQVVYSKCAGTEVDVNGSKHLILKEDDVVGILETEDIKDLKPLNDQILIKVAEVEQQTAGGLFLTDADKEKPSIGTVIAVGPGPVEEEGNREPLPISQGNTVLYAKYAGNDFEGSDGSQYLVLRASNVMAVLS